MVQSTQQEHSEEYPQHDTDHNNSIDPKKLAEMMAYSDRTHDGKINIEERTAMTPNRNFKTVFNHYMKTYVDFIVPRDKGLKFTPIRRKLANLEEGDAIEVDGAIIPDGSLWPPPVCMILISIAEIICYILNKYISRENKVIVPDTEGVVARHLIYNPHKRQQFWRFLSYMMVHIGWVHLTTNLLVQILLGVALEFRNGWWRVTTVYIAGVIAGSLVTSITDPTVYLAGASGGVYAIISAHLSNIILNWKELDYPVIQLFAFLIVMSADVSTAIYNRHILGDTTPIGYAAHFGGTLAGFLVGIWVLKNSEPTNKEKYLWWAAFVFYIILMLAAILLNVFWKSHFP